jgi:hypothetical protein
MEDQKTSLLLLILYISKLDGSYNLIVNIFTDDPSFRMRRYNKALLLLMPAISAAIFPTGNIAFASGGQSISESASIECNEGSCYKVSCINDQCQTFSYNQPSSEQSAGEATTTIMQPAEESTIVMQPVDDVTTEQYIEVPVEFCDDGLDNDDDIKIDEECGSDTFSSALPNDLIEIVKEGKQQNEEYEHSDD